MRITIFLVAALFAAVCAASGEMDVYLLMGQSNMAGRGALAAEDRAAPDGIVKLDASGKWVPASEPIHFDKPVAGAGLAASFAKRVARPGVAVGLVPCAVGGTPLARWMPGADLYKAAVARAKIAQKSGTIRAILWHQGEGDCAEGKCETYGERLATMVAALRRDIGVGDDVPFIAGELGDFLSVRHPGSKYTVVNDGIRSCAKRVANFRAVSAKGLTPNGDNLHFNTKSLREFGERYAEAYLSAPSAAPRRTQSSGGLLVGDGDQIAFLGDSITQFGSVKAGYVNLVMKGLKHEGVKAVKIPAGVSGERATNMLARVYRVLSHKPALMTLSCGVNDVWQDKNGRRIEEFKSCVREILDRAEKKGVRVLVMTATPVHYPADTVREETMKSYNAFLKEEAAARGLPVADTGEAVKALIAKGGDDPVTVDGVHMAYPGNCEMAWAVLRALGVDPSHEADIRAEWEEVKSAYERTTAFSGAEWKKLMKNAKAAGLTPEDYIKAAALK